MSELRQDPTTRDWVVIAPERALRPHLVVEPQARAAGEPEAGCPFCAGHEADTPPEVWRLPADKALRSVLAGLTEVLDDPDYNAIIQSAPPGDESREYFVWHLRVLPRLATPAGFELGTGMAINPSMPEETAALMRRAISGVTSTSTFGWPKA